MKILNYLLVGFMLTFMMSCQNQENPQNQEINLSENELSTEIPANAYLTASGIEAPLKNVNVPVKTFTINATKEQIIEIDETGTSIEIPANAFVDADGNLVENVNISFREFHSAADILASGIPMQMTAPDGSSGYMRSAGMFDIQGFANGKAVFVAEQKELKVNLASYHNDADYDVWRLDDNNKQWLNRGLSQVTKNDKKGKALKYVEKNKVGEAPLKPYKFDKNKPVLEFNINLENFPELKEMNGVMWQYAGGDDSKDPAKNAWIYKTDWDHADVEQFEDSNLFKLTLKNSKKEFVTTVCPSQSDEEFKNAMAAYSSKLKQYEENKLTYEDMKQMAEKQADFMRSMSVEGFGIYNYDRMMKDDEFLPVVANFDFGTMIPGMNKFTTVYMIYDDRDVMRYPVSDWSKIRIDPNGKTQMVAILPNNQIATIGSNEMAAIMSDIRAAKGGKYTFKMNFHDGEKVNSFEQLQNIMEILA